MSTFGPLNFVNVGPHGTFKPSGSVQTCPEDVDAIFHHLRESGAQRLVVHFHGGLIGEGTGMDIAEKMWRLFKDDAHPVTFVWETGPVETVKANILTIHKTRLFKKAQRLIIRHVAKRLGVDIGGRGGGEAPTLNEIDAELGRGGRFGELEAGARDAAMALDAAELDAELGDVEVELEEELEADAEMEEVLEGAAEETDLLDPDIVDAERHGKGIISMASAARRLALVVVAVIKRYMDQRDHGFYPTAVEEILRGLYLADLGAWMWGGMKAAGREMWLADDGPADESSHVGTYFLTRLTALADERPDLTIDLVGHSAGSIAICHLLRTAAERAPGLRFRNVLFLAPACRSELLHEEVVKHPERYQSFRMFTMKDELEREDALVKGVYVRSLLYFISGVLEDVPDAPLAGLHRHARAEQPHTSPELLGVRDFLTAAGKERMVMSRTTSAGAGLNSASRSHGDFDDEPVTTTSLREIIAD